MQRRQQQKEEEEGEGGGLARLLAHSTLACSVGRPASTPTKTTTTTKSVLSMNDGRIDHNFRRRESIRGSADSAAQGAGGRQAGRQAEKGHSEEGRKIEKMRRSEVEEGEGEEEMLT